MSVINFNIFSIVRSLFAADIHNDYSKNPCCHFRNPFWISVQIQKEININLLENNLHIASQNYIQECIFYYEEKRYWKVKLFSLIINNNILSLDLFHDPAL